MIHPILVYRGDAKHADDVLRALNDAPVREHPIWEANVSSADAPQAVLVVASGADLRGGGDLHDLLQRHRPIRRALIPELTPESARRVRRLRLPSSVAIIWDAELPTGLRRWLAAEPTVPWEEIASRLEARARGVPLLERACSLALRSSPPPPSVVDVADGLRVPPGTLHYYWRTVIGDPSLKRVLEWRVLTFALELRSAGRDWVGIAHALDIHPRTLARTSRRLLELPLRKVEERPEKVATSLQKWVDAWEGFTAA